MANTVTIHTKTVDDGGLVKLRGQFDSLGKGMASSTAVGVLGAKALGFGLGLVHEAADGLVNAISGSIKAASDLNETLQKSGVVFGSAADEIKRFGEGAATSMGLSENAAVAAAATFGNLFKSLGTAPEKVAPMSEALVKLAADLASFNNIPIDEALAKLQSGIVGQERPLRELGVAISAASVDVEAAALGFKKLNGHFTEGEKVQARYALIFKQTGTAQGDFARTSDQLANQQRILQAELDDTSANLGKQLLPAVLDVERGFVKLFDTINGGLPNGIGTAIRQQIETGTLDQLQTSKAALEKAINDPLLNMFGAPQAEALRHQLADVDAAIAVFAAGTGVSSGKVADDFTLVRQAFHQVSDGVSSDSGAIATSYGAMGKSALDFAADAEKTKRRIIAANDATVAQLEKDASAAIHGAFDPLITADKLRVTNADIAANKIILASKKATAAQKIAAHDALDQLHMDQATYLSDLAKTGDTTSVAFKTGVAELKNEIAHATGPTKTFLEGILVDLTSIDKIHATPTVTVKIIGAAALTTLAKQLGYVGNQDLYKKAYRPPAHNAGGGWVGKNGPELSWLGEKGPEYVVSNDKLGSLGSGPAGPGGSIGGGSMVLNVTVNASPGMTPAESAAIGRNLASPIAQEFVRRGLIPRRTLSGITG